LVKLHAVLPSPFLALDSKKRYTGQRRAVAMGYSGTHGWGRRAKKHGPNPWGFGPASVNPSEGAVIFFPACGFYSEGLELAPIARTALTQLQFLLSNPF
ncbi:MAG: hypothetical protein ACRDJU_13045, partial [Actinomycetota bacterium]